MDENVPTTQVPVEPAPPQPLPAAPAPVVLPASPSQGGPQPSVPVEPVTPSQIPKPKSKFLIILLVILVIVTLGLLGALAYQKYLPRSSTSPAIQPSPISLPAPTPTPDVTANWKTYTNTKYGFEIKYPLDFTEQKAESDTTLLKITKTDSGSSYNFMIYIRKNYKVNQIISGVEEAKEINIGDHLGYEYFYIEGAGTSGVALIQVGQDALSINFDCIGDDHNFTSPDDKKIYVQGFFDQILSTFRFLK